MRFIADLHIHSHYSRATSSQLVPEQLWRWGQLKGLQVIATGDLTHPAWLEELQAALAPTARAEGLFVLNPERAAGQTSAVPAACRREIYFILSGEISSIYKKAGAVRKVHNVVFFPSFDAAVRFQHRLERIGNILSDGRPILGLDARDLLEIVLETDPGARLIPAHIWTPWFSVLGSQSGFDSLEACFGDLTPHLFAVETGLSSDPPMNWRLSMLDGLHLVSNSDAHSPEKLGREANLFDTNLSYPAIFAALADHQSLDFAGTIEFFPEEGKYHMDGHRKCGRMMRPAETLSHGGLCPVCGKPATLGVSYRVQELADRPEGFHPPGARPFHSLIPLPELLGEVLDAGPATKKVQGLYHALLRDLGPELAILMEVPLADLERTAGLMVAEAVRRMRSGEVVALPGYDGEYGHIALFHAEERAHWLRQAALFAPVAAPRAASEAAPAAPPARIAAAHHAAEQSGDPWGLNSSQTEAVTHRGTPLIIQAGPGTGKTRTLTRRIARLLEEDFARPEEILAITFTRKAAREMQVRLVQILGTEKAAPLQIQTFHTFGKSLLQRAGAFFGRAPGFRLIDTETDGEFRQAVTERSGERLSATALQRISALKGLLYTPETLPQEIARSLPANFPALFRTYESLLVEWNAVDFDDLIALPVRLLRFEAGFRRQLLGSVQVIAVDEFQDINTAQYELFHLFALHARDVCVIGDPDQSIYGFRGASPEFFSRMQSDFPAARRITLRENYRSAPAILAASTGMLRQGNPPAPGETLIPRLASDLKVQFHAAASDRTEALFVIQQIESLMGGTSHYALDRRVGSPEAGSTCSFGDFAILLRSRLLADPLEEVLAKSGLPFKRIADQYEQDRMDLTRGEEGPPADEIETATPLTLDPRGDRIQILTLHAAKGLEFPVVFIIGCEENLLPFAFGRTGDVEEERRLFYVGMTRAQNRLYLSHARTRLLRGQRHAQIPSRFLQDINKQLLQKHTVPRGWAGANHQMNLFKQDPL
ncbi:MAG TPA: UvrD-helicase domain-containing protein [bacterium]|nr:UvrD-helicase domain-containing protein [bacterium]HQI47620.1 UvrD-helicase domain-containing protein [bacterium]HQJ63613.1 UvrD-helicase domain-containing protein [bacterium]